LIGKQRIVSRYAAVDGSDPKIQSHLKQRIVSRNASVDDSEPKRSYKKYLKQRKMSRNVVADGSRLLRDHTSISERASTFNLSIIVQI
jgi:hypothetical protein